MEYMLLSVLKSVNQALICEIDGLEILFENSDEAIDTLQKANKHYSLAAISARDDTVVLKIQDITEEIKKHNEKFVTECKKQYGYEPSFF